MAVAKSPISSGASAGFFSADQVAVGMGEQFEQMLKNYGAESSVSEWN